MFRAIDIRLVASLALTLVVSIVAGCSSGRGDVLQSGDDFTVHGALAEIPRDLRVNDYAVINAADLEVATQLSGLERPESTNRSDAIVDWLAPLTGGPSNSEPLLYVPLAEVFQPTRLTDVDDFEQELGWSVVDVDAFVEWLSLPQSLAVVTGSFRDQTFSVETLTRIDEDVVSAGDGEDFTQDLSDTTTARPTGIPLRMARVDDRIAIAPATPIAHQWLEDEHQSLADDPRLDSVAQQLDNADAVAAVLAYGSFVVPSWETLQRGGHDIEHVIQYPFDALGIGWSVENDSARISVAYHFPSEEMAAESSETLDAVFTEGSSLTTGQPIADLVILDSVSVEGSVVTVALIPTSGRSVATLYRMFQSFDLPFVHATSLE